MNESNSTKFGSLRFVDEGPWFRKLMLYIDRFMGLNHIFLPARTEHFLKRFTLKDLGGVIGLDDPTSQAMLQIHARRYMRYYSFLSLIGLVIYLVLGLIIAAVASTLLLTILTNRSLSYFGVGTLFSLVALLLIFVAYRTAFRFSVFLMDRMYADTVCVLQSISIVVELSRDNVLSHPDRRRTLLKRMNHLSRCVRFLALSHSETSQANQMWLTEYFGKTELYIREREKLVVIPVATTLADLRRDFNQLAKVFSISQYGDLPSAALVSQPQLPTTTRAQRVMTVILRFLGIMTPVLILGFLLLDPSRMSALGPNGTSLTLILVAWLLLAIDGVLHLGIVERVASVAKAMKDLQ
jgi:hypothetical protein